MRLALPLLVALAAPAGAGEGGHAHADAPAGLEIGHGWMAATAGDDGRAFVRLRNETGGALVLTGLEIEGIAGAEAALVAPRIDGGAGVLPLTPFVLDPGVELEMAPEGPHVALTGIGPRAEGGEIDLVLLFEGLGAVEARVAVEGADAESASHAGHDH